MNLLKSKLRRTTTVLAGSILGLAGAAVFAAPASAHTPTVTGDAVCVNGGSWAVYWAVGNDYDTDATVAEVSVVDGAGKDLPLTGDLAEEGAGVPANSEADQHKQVGGFTEVTDADVTKATITVVLAWPDGYTNDGKGDHGAPVTRTVHKPPTCVTPEPSSSTPTSTESPSATPSPTSTESPGLPVPTPSMSDEPEDFTPIVEFYCDAVVIGMDNPADGVTWTIHFTTSKGEKRDLTVKPGEKKTDVFSASAGFKVTVTLSVTVDGKTYTSPPETITWVQPKGCENGSGGGLPVTGAAAGGIAGGAAVLLAIGAMLFVLARRRKVRFTA